MSSGVERAGWSTGGRQEGSPGGHEGPGLAAPGRWERLFDDIEAAMDEAERADLAAEVADRTRGEVARLRLVDRLRAAIGYGVGLTLPAERTFTGTLRDVGPDWLLLTEPPGREVLVALAAVCAVTGLGDLSMQPGSEGRVTARLGLRSVLRRLARDRAQLAAALTDGSVLIGTFDRIGADFFELAEHPAGEPRRASAVRRVRTVPFPAFVLARSV